MPGNLGQVSSSGQSGTINTAVFQRASLPFYIAGASFIALVFLMFVLPIIGSMIGQVIKVGLDLSGRDNTSDWMFLLAWFLPHLMLFCIIVVSAYVGYKLVVASGASPENPIPPQKYELLAPLVQAGKAEAIDQYVRLSSLRGFTGMFTKLGLTGLPLTTVTLTIMFVILAVLPLGSEEKKNLFDLAKLTLGAFIGSFVQRQVEQRRAGHTGEQTSQEGRPAANVRPPLPT